MARNRDRKQETEKEGEGAVRAFRAIAVIVLGAAIGFFVYTTTVSPNSSYPFKLGLDLAGGSHLVYQADVSKIDPSEVPDLMNVLRSVIERRVNIFGVSEPIVQVEESSFVTNQRIHRLVVELPGVTNVQEAIKEIGKTPLLEFKLVNPNASSTDNSLASTTEPSTLTAASSTAASGTSTVSTTENSGKYIDTGLTGRYLQGAQLEFGQGNNGGLSNEPIVSVTFNSTGADLFEKITADHVGQQLAIFLDGKLISAPTIRERIGGGKAIISGGFTPQEAKDLVQNLNFGALPVPISLVSTQTIGASLGTGILNKGIKAGAIGVLLVIIFMLIWYRLPGVIAGLALLFYLVGMLALFKLIPVTLTAAGLAGLILSVGMAVDANVLVFERMKEEYESGKDSCEAAKVGFSRAWSAIRDGNMTSILSSILLFWFGTSIVKGFALVFGIGVLVSMVTAIGVTRTLLLALPAERLSDNTFFSKLYGAGFRKHKQQ
jgi:protein-export membrane protein SecD